MSPVVSQDVLSVLVALSLMLSPVSLSLYSTADVTRRSAELLLPPGNETDNDGEEKRRKEQCHAR